MLNQRLQRPDGVIAYDDQGEGLLVLCVPAGGDLRTEYRFLTPALVAAGYRVATMDLRGQGQSSAFWPIYSAAAVGSDILALIEHLSAGPAVVIGTSVACAAAIWAAAEAPPLVDGLVLISSFAQAATPWKIRLMTRLLLNPLWGQALYARYFPTMYPSARPADFDAHLAQVRAMLGEPGRLLALRRLFDTAGSAWDAQVEQVRVPTLILMGTRDPDFRHPEQEAYRLAERMLHAPAQVQLIAGAGHHPHAEQPAQVLPHLLAFLHSHSARLWTQEV